MNRRTLRQTFTVARRDFVATVFAPTFLIFLLAPLIMGSFSAIGGMGAASVAKSGAAKVRIVAILPDAEATTAREIDTRLRKLYRSSEERPPELQTVPPEADTARQARALFDAKSVEASAVLYGPLDRPTILYSSSGKRTADYLGEIAEQTLRADRTGGGAPLSVATKTRVSRHQVSASDQKAAAFFTITALFMMSILLTSQSIGTMAEERSNKVIEVLAAAVPLESVFLGKLIGMFGVAMTFLLFWGTIAANIGSVVPPEIASKLADLQPAIGWPVFLPLFFAYFTMSFLILGGMFLAVGAQATSQREIQLLSLPMTMLQLGMFGFSAAAAADPNGWVGIAAQVFPFSSPFAMGGRAAIEPEIWPHLLALVWQGLWVAIVITLGARWFRRGVLQSGSGSGGFLKRFRKPARA